MEEISKNMDGTEYQGPQWSSEAPAPEQQKAMIEMSTEAVKSIINEIKKEVPDLTEQQIFTIGTCVVGGIDALLEGSQDAYGEPKDISPSPFDNHDPQPTKPEVSKSLDDVYSNSAESAFR